MRSARLRTTGPRPRMPDLNATPIRYRLHFRKIGGHLYHTCHTTLPARGFADRVSVIQRRKDDLYNG